MYFPMGNFRIGLSSFVVFFFSFRGPPSTVSISISSFFGRFPEIDVTRFPLGPAHYIALLGRFLENGMRNLVLHKCPLNGVCLLYVLNVYQARTSRIGRRMARKE